MLTPRRLVAAAALAVALVPAPCLSAQEQPTGERAADGLRFLVRAGANASELRGELGIAGLGPVSFDVGYGFAAAAGVDVSLGERFSVQTEVVIVRRLTRLDLTDPGLRSKLSVNYLELPLLLKWYPGGKSGNRVHLDVGPVPAWRLAASREVRRGGTIVDVPSEDLLRTTDWSLGLGVGFEFPELFAHFTVDLRYLHGLDRANVAEAPRDARWSTLQTMVGVAF